MMINLFFLILLLPLNIYALPQDISVGGYIENNTRLSSTVMPVTADFLNNTRGKLSVSGTKGKDYDFSVVIVGAVFIGDISLNVLPYMPRYIIPFVPDNFKNKFSYNYNNDLWMQEGYATVYKGPFRLRAGRQKLYSGTGYAFNPTDLFNKKNPLDPAYEVEGIDSIFAGLTLAGETEFNAVYSFGSSKTSGRYYKKITDGDYQLKIKTHFGRWDTGLFYTKAMQRFTDAEATALGVRDSLTVDLTWRMFAGSFSGELFNIGIHGEGGYVFVDSYRDVIFLNHELEDHLRLLLGMDYTFDSRLYVIFEYLYIGQGLKDSVYTISDRISVLTGERPTLSRHTTFSGIRYPVTNLLSAELYWIFFACDSSSILNPWIVWNAMTDMSFSFSLSVPLGQEQSINGRSGIAALGRLRYSF
jgi:hypothetical protein